MVRGSHFYCLDSTAWDVFQESSSDSDELTDLVSSWISYCEDIVIPVKSVERWGVGVTSVTRCALLMSILLQTPLNIVKLKQVLALTILVAVCWFDVQNSWPLFLPIFFITFFAEGPCNAVTVHYSPCC